MNADDPRHGTTRGHAAGCRELCCREARNLDEARRRKYRQALGITRSTPALGTQRRIRALMALGWTSRDIADHCGWATTQAVTELLKARRFVYATTADRIDTAYRDLCMTVGPSEKNRRDAARKGWAPPLAWDDIDTDEHPVVGRYEPSPRADLLREYAARGDNLTHTCRALKITHNALNAWCIRTGNSDLYRALAAREGDWNSGGRIARDGAA